MRKTIRILFATLLAAVSAGTLAHHSTANFNKNEVTTITGKVTYFSFANPHSFIDVDVAEGNDTAPYKVFATSKVVLIRYGWRPTSVKPGDTITVSGYPDYDNPSFLYLTEITFADGHKWLRGDVAE
ncbi:MAG: hypothetical protein H6978_10635 [Gammaproteobacteria bacterium]|nr:hypothetical protein [Gammaproteobacteria bacterium]